MRLGAETFFFLGITFLISDSGSDSVSGSGLYLPPSSARRSNVLFLFFVTGLICGGLDDSLGEASSSWPLSCDSDGFVDGPVAVAAASREFA